MCAFLKHHPWLRLLLLACLAVVVYNVLHTATPRLRYVGRRTTLGAAEQARRLSMPPKYPMVVGGWSVEGIFDAYQRQLRYSSHRLNARWYNSRTGDTWTFIYDPNHQPVAISADGRFMLQLPAYPDHPSLVEGVIERIRGRDPDAPPYRRSEIRVIQRPHTLVAVLPVATRPDPVGWSIHWRGKDLEGDAVFLDTPRTLAIKQGGEWLIFRW